MQLFLSFDDCQVETKDKNPVDEPAATDEVVTEPKMNTDLRKWNWNSNFYVELYDKPTGELAIVSEMLV